MGIYVQESRRGSGCLGIGLPWVEMFIAWFEAGLGLLEKGHKGSATFFCAKEGRKGEIRGNEGEVGSLGLCVPGALLENVGD
jgi:hypothetical protein